jgi:hypothetical protein
MWRLRGRQTDADIDGLHVLMGVAMAGMLEPRLGLLPYTAWLAVFAAGAAWFTWRAIRPRARLRDRGHSHSHPAPHVVECATMIYMLLPGGPAGHARAMAMPGMSASGVANPAIALILALFMLGYMLWTADQLTARTPSRAPALSAHTAATPDRRGPAAALAHPAATVLSPRLAALSRIVMSVAMGYMLIGML